MLVEDDQPILEMMEILLRRIGYEPILVPDVMEALQRIQNDPPSLVLLDIMMTPINGWEFLENSVRYTISGVPGDPVHRFSPGGGEDCPAAGSLPGSPETRYYRGAEKRYREVPCERDGRRSRIVFFSGSACVRGKFPLPCCRGQGYIDLPAPAKNFACGRDTKCACRLSP